MEKVLTREIKSRIHEIILAFGLILYIGYFTFASFLRYENFFSGRFDLGNMAQTVWNTLHGRIFILTDPNGTREISRLAFHSDFILIFLAPFYLIWEDPRMLLLIQTLTVSLGGVFVYLIAQHVLKNKTISLVLALSYFINPAVNFTNLYDFHSVTLATTFLLATFYFILKRKYGLMLIFLFLASITKEQVWIITGLIGIYLLFSHRQKALGGSIFFISAFTFYILIWYLMPQNLGKEHFAISYYSDYGDSPAKIIGNVLVSPLKTLGTIFMPDRILFIKQLFLPFGYLSIFAPLFLIFAGPDLAIDLLSSNPPLHQIYYQYSATITPFIFISVIFGIKFIKSKFLHLPYIAFALMIFIFSVTSAYSFGPLPFAKNPSLNTYRKTLPEKSEIYDYLSSLSENEKIAVTNNLGSHLSHRRYIYVIPQGIDTADRVIFLTSRSNNSGEKRALMDIQSDPRFLPVFKSGGFLVFKRLRR